MPLLMSNDTGAFVQVVADAVRDIRQLEIQSNAIALLGILARRGIGLHGSDVQFYSCSKRDLIYSIFNWAAETRDDATKAIQQLACHETEEVRDLSSAALRSLA